MGPWASWLSVDPSDDYVITVAAVRSSTATLTAINWLVNGNDA